MYKRQEELSVKLFERAARGMVLTDAGHVLYRYAIENRKQLDGLRSKVEEFGSLRRGQVKIATVEGLLASFLSDFVVDLAGKYPGISIALTVVGSRDVAELVGHNDVDLGFVFGRAPRRDLIELARMRQSLCPVSYTHLVTIQRAGPFDRQLKQRAAKGRRCLAVIRIAVVLGAEQFHEIRGLAEDILAGIPVSYTHLDVYKRQITIGFTEYRISNTSDGSM